MIFFSFYYFSFTPPIRYICSMKLNPTPKPACQSISTYEHHPRLCFSLSLSPSYFSSIFEFFLSLPLSPSLPLTPSLSLISPLSLLPSPSLPQSFLLSLMHIHKQTQNLISPLSPFHHLYPPFFLSKSSSSLSFFLSFLFFPPLPLPRTSYLVFTACVCICVCKHCMVVHIVKLYLYL